MKPEEYDRMRGRSRRRRRNRGREILVGFLRLLLALFLLICLTVGGVFGYRYWEGNKTSETPLETSREVAPETMGESH
ncbi:hypothetical protein BN3590_01202 [Clostridium sp. C105KSO15]|jgi:hypothetical protein|nr:hypothetical protein BN3590_01202 [Clostridium sp. C105KSO15]